MMTIKRSILALGTALAAVPSGLARADIVATPEPGGLSTLVLLPGSSGLASNPSSWFVGESGASLYTYWAGDPVVYSASLPASPDSWRLGVTAMNVQGPLDASYSAFNVSVLVNGVSAGTLSIPASDTQWNTAWIDLGPRVGPMSVALAWTNDSWLSGVYDANISLGAVQFAGRSVPTPGTGSLAAVALALLGVRTRRPR